MKQTYILGAIVTILILLYLGSILLQTMQEKEGFQNPSAITLNFCPLWAPQIQTAKGNTDCCEGELLNGKCSSRSFCTLSAPHDNITTCILAWRQYFAQKNRQCPSTMPHYFEQVKVKGGNKGCSASAPVEDGSGPRNISANRCKIYNTERENRSRPDSCFVEKERLKVRCPPFAGYTSRVEKVMIKEGGVDAFGSFVCSYVNSLGQRNSCNDERSLLAMWDRQNPNWRTDRTRYTQLENISCRTFIDRERRKEMERQRIEAERRRAEQERRKREAVERQFRGFRNFFARFRENARRAAEEARRRSQRAIQQLQNRVRQCVR